MFQKILIANRGAIACRIIRTLTEMGISSVAVYAEADRNSLHVDNADEAFSLGDGAAKHTYLNQEKIIAIAKKCGAQAIHPGYGFLSENSSFVSLCEHNGIRFIGPSVDNMRAFALKHTARELAQQHNVPLVPGSDLLASKDDALVEAEKIGYPIIIKSSAGGGGIGMEICRNAQALDAAFDSVIRLSQNNFSDGRIFLEKYIEDARHIEVQVFGNGQGLAVELGERDCSLQRRNQKVIEEAPAPNLPDNIRQKLHATAQHLLASIQYQSAGTVEFIYDIHEQAFYFLEVNTRLQVEHGVTEAVYGVDLVQWMIEQAFSPLVDLNTRRAQLEPNGHAIQVRIYAENPAKNFLPSAGLLSHVSWPQNNHTQETLRIDTWVNSGIEVSAFFDPMIAKMIVWSQDRESTRIALERYVSNSTLYGIETNLSYLQQLLNDSNFANAQVTTRYLASLSLEANNIDVLSPGTMTTIQDLPGRKGYWEVGVPPSGPFDSYSFSLANKAVGNRQDCAGLEITITGPTLYFHCDSRIAVTGANIPITLDEQTQPMWQSIEVKAGQTLVLGKIAGTGARAYLSVAGGIDCPDYLGSKSTFTLGQFGGHCGRALRTGDTLKITAQKTTQPQAPILPALRPNIRNHWVLNVIYGPHGAPDFFTPEDIDTFFAADWQVHYNSSRTGIRLVGPKPQWARESGGEAGMHPSNIHDNAYAFGTVDFTGDMPVILGPDGPSLGGFVCPATVINADLWKLGQLKAGDTLRFNPVTIDAAVELDRQRRQEHTNASPNALLTTEPPSNCVLQQIQVGDTQVTLRLGGDRFVLVEFGQQVLDLRLRFQVYALREFFQTDIDTGIDDLTPGIRSLQIHYDPHLLPLAKLVALVEKGLSNINNMEDVRVLSRVVHLPLSWDDKACHAAVEKYQQSVRENAPWCPSNIEFIRRINGLDSINQVKDIVFNARYVVMGLGDVYLGAPVATPLDPRHRLVTTKYNPARTWTAENSVGIGGAYMCIYGMEGPGGYQFIGRTLQMWNRYQKTQEFSEPWLLRFFDQIRFYEVGGDDLLEIRKNFPKGRYPLKITHEEFSLREYERFLEQHSDSISDFQSLRETAFQEELERWRASGQFHFDSSQQLDEDKTSVPDDVTAVESAVAGSVWKVLVHEGQIVRKGETLLILESMKMEIEVSAPCDGTLTSIIKKEGATVSAGQALMYVK